MCWLLDTQHWIDRYITVCGKLVFDYNLKVALPLKHDSLNDLCRGNDTDEIIFVGVVRLGVRIPS